MNYSIEEIQKLLKQQSSTRQRWLYEDILKQAEQIEILETKNETLSSLLFFAEQHVSKGDQK